MFICWVYKVLPVLVIPVSKMPFFLSSSIHGWTPGPVSLLLNGYSEDILTHELQHSRQSG